MALSLLRLWKKDRLTSFARWTSADFCGQLDDPGAVIDAPTHVDFTQRRTTRDQLRIEAVLAEMDLSAARLLHVGVGDSGLAERFAPACLAIDGITVSQAECDAAVAANLANYHVSLVNKYGRDFSSQVRGAYDLIVDNNLASFVCCLYHLAQMFDHYRWALKPGGRILTDQQGMDWVVRDRRWRMTFDDLAALAGRFGFAASKFTEHVFVLTRTQ